MFVILVQRNYLLGLLAHTGALSRSLVHPYPKPHPRVWSHAPMPPEPLSRRQKAGRNHWSQVPLTRGENLGVAVPLWGRSHHPHNNMPGTTGTEFALERWRYPREEVAKSEMGTPLFDPTRCVRESWISFRGGWRHLSPRCPQDQGGQRKPGSAPPGPRVVRAGPQPRV